MPLKCEKVILAHELLTFYVFSSSIDIMNITFVDVLIRRYESDYTNGLLRNTVSFSFEKSLEHIIG